MIDPLALLDDVFSSLDGSETPPVPGFGSSFPGAVPGNEPTYTIDSIDSSRTSRCSRLENEGSGENNFKPTMDDFASPENVARARSYVETPGTPGTPGTEGKSPAGSTLPQFPVKDREPGTPGTESGFCGPPPLDLNRAAPQRSDWWTGPAMAEADRLAPASEPLPITPADVWAGVDRETSALADLGLSEDETRRRAIEITVAKIRNSEALAERQANGGRCHVCDEALDDSVPVVAVLSGRRGAPLYLHAGCHDAYRARRAALVDRIMAAAGLQREAGR